MAFPISAADTGVPVGTGSAVESSKSGIAWTAIFGGAIAALAITLLFVTLGSGVGLASVSPWRGSGATGTTVSIASVVWLIVMHWIASGMGGYLTGRLRTKWTGLHTHEVFFRDTAHGFLSWATATLVGAVIIANMAGYLASGAAAIGSGVASAVANGATQVAQSTMSASKGQFDPNAYFLDRMFRADKSSPGNPGLDSKAQASQILLNSLKTGEISPPDRAYLVKLVSDQTGSSPDEASKRVDQMITDAKAAEVKVQQAADAVRKAAAKMSIMTALAMLIGAFVACVSAALGGQQRDEF